jgi:predicted  nucleic acid-binding Zn-ribbon protein
VRNQFAVLRELQGLDDRLRALRGEHQHLPQQLQAYEIACAEARQQLTQLQEAVAQTERQRRAVERELEGVQANLAKTQSKLHEVKTNKEYSAILAEIATGKQRITALEDQVLELMELLEQHRQASQQQEQRMQGAAETLATQRESAQQAQAVLQQQIAAQERQR